MSVLSSSLKRRRRSPNKMKFKAMGNHDEFLSRIKKTLYYGKFPLTERFSLPVSELAAEIYSEVKLGKSLERLCVEEVAQVSRSACVSPCSLIFALFYLERLKTSNPDYIERVSPSELFVVSMMVASKFIYDDGEEDEVFNSEWAASAGIDIKEINKYEKNFLKAIDWEVFVKDRNFWTGLRNMEMQVARKEGHRRGWFSYTELEALLDCVDAWSLAHTIVMVSFVCLASYTASIMTLCGSAAIASRLPGHHLNPAYRASLNQLNLNSDSNLSTTTTTTTTDASFSDLIDNDCPTPNWDCSLSSLETNRTTAPVHAHSWLVTWLEESNMAWNSTLSDDIIYLNRRLDEFSTEIDAYRNEIRLQDEKENSDKLFGHTSSSWLTDLFYGNLSPVAVSSMSVFPFNLLLTQ